MNQDLLNILSDHHGHIDNQLLMDYLDGKLSEQEKQAVEEMMAENDFTNDALEGLGSLPDHKNVKLSVDQLNRQLRESLKKKKARRGRRAAEDGTIWTYTAIILILLLCFTAYFIIHRMTHR